MAEAAPTRKHADDLQDILEEGRERWPLPQEEAIVNAVSEFSAFATSDSERLRVLCDWNHGAHQNLAYIVDPLPERIKEAFADLIVGSEPGFETARPGDSAETDPPPKDQALLDELIEENDLPSELHDAVGQMVAEGETWWRIYVDRDAYEHPVIEWHSRADVVPLYRGRKLLAVAFVTDLDDLAPDAPVLRVGDASKPVIGSSIVTGTPGPRNWREQEGKPDSDTVYRYVEVQTGGFTRNLLYRGTARALGDRVPLSEHEVTEDLPEEWEHGLEITSPAGRSVPVMLAGRVTNGKAGRLGRSQFARSKGLFYVLNKLQSIGDRNADLTMQKRAVLMQEMVEGLFKETGSSTGPVALPDAFMAPRDAMGDQQAMGILEFSDTWAEAIKLWDDHIVDKALTRCRIAPQLVGRHTEDAATGPALRARLLDSVLAADGKALKVDDEIPRMLRAAQMLSALPEEQGGCGHQWVSPEEPPVFTRTSILPEDEDLEATRYSTLSVSGLISRQTAIERMNPEWDADRVNEELERIAAEQPEEQEATSPEASAIEDPFAAQQAPTTAPEASPGSPAGSNGQGSANEATLRIRAA